jgi:hypothetical protein
MASRLHKLTQNVASLRATLVQPTPEGLNSHLPALTETIERLSALSQPARDEARDLNALGLELAACRTLIEHGLSTTRILTGILTAATSGYSPTGIARPLAASSKIFLEG